MNIASGTVLGPYEIRSPLGAGGMGEVYRAHDKRLRRDVALKVLSGDLLRDPLKRRRFADEAQSASALNHPNIVSVFDVSLDTIPPFIVSELVEGSTLSDIMSGRPMPVRRVLDIALQVADGMAAAHQAGIVHRDLKPQNIMVRPDGRVKILDFGLAKHSPESKDVSDDDDTEAMSLTAEGAVVGTAYYMSPEQARGKQVDKRSDIFSFGIILYEMLSGKRPFGGASRIDTLSAIVRDDPAPIESPIPMLVRWTLERCLAKEPAERYESTRDLYNDLRKQREHYELISGSTEAVASVRRTTSKRRWLPAALLIAGILAGLAIAVFLAPPSPPTVLHASQFHPLASVGATEDSSPTWSPDGLSIAYRAYVDGVTQVFTKGLDAATPLQVTHSARDCSLPIWSADGGRLLFRMNGSVWSAGAAGGEPQMIVENAERFVLSRDGQMLAFVRHQTPTFHVWLSSPPGAAPVQYSPAPFEATDYNGARLAFSPDGHKLLLWVNMESVQRAEFWELPLPPGSGQPRKVLPSLANSFVVRGMSWMPDNRRVVLACAIPPDVYRTHLYVAAVDKNRVDPLLTGIGREEFPDVSRDGKRLVYSAVDVDHNIVEIPLDGSPVRDLLVTNRTEHSPAWSPRVREFAYVTDRRGTDEIWVKAREGGWDKPVVTQRSFSDGSVKVLDSPIFSPDGERIAFRAGRSIWIASAAGGAPIRLTNTADVQELMPTWSADGNWIAFSSQGKQVKLMKARVGGREPAVELIQKGYDISAVPDWSPKGDWIAAMVDGSTSLVSTDGKTVRKVRTPPFEAKAWSRDGKLLYGLVSAGGKQALVALDVASLKEKRITDISPNIKLMTLWYPGLRLSLAPDDKSLAVTSRRINADIWMLDDFDQSPGLLARLGLRRPGAIN